MVTSRLIDINTAAITYRRECLQALGKRLYNTCIGCIKTMNSLLPEDEEGDKGHKYRIIFDDEEYQREVNAGDKIVCPKCNKEFDYATVNFASMNIPSGEQIVLQKNSETVWVCQNTQCEKINRLSDSEIIEDVIQTPHYARFVPYPPKKRMGLLSHLSFHDEMSAWVWLCLENLEEAFTRFRDDNWNKDKNLDLNDKNIDTSLEEL